MLANACFQLLAQVDGPAPLFMRLEREDRIRVFLALAAILLLGFVMIFLAWWGAKWTRRYSNKSAASTREATFSPLSPDDWAKKPLHEAIEQESDGPME